MSDVAIFVSCFVGLLVVRAIIATVVFCYLLPADGHCPNCDRTTLWIQSRFVDRVLPWLRSSWCPSCGWNGLLRHGRRRRSSGSPAAAPSTGPSARPIGTARHGARGIRRRDGA